MDRSYRSWMIVALAAGVASCATGMRTSADVPARVLDGSAHVTREDAAYMSRVERIARRRGVEVHWVNPPRTSRTLADRQ